ncbi:PE-PGRS family protein PE_PGRS30 [Mycobacterium simulans]|uniref:PE family protein n=1 Tax=Mycobacterium simulans TaxID=627089 RepID=UPI001748EDCF|nr:PE family protein [Mycobacterium simulans]SON63432.1 PE-PGRS family protein PE_PGRS30 [Mycobacterium simulans]
MSYVIAVPELVEAAAQELASIRSALNEAAATAAGPTTGVAAAAADEVSMAISQLFGAHGQEFQALSAQAAAFHDEFVNLLNAGAAAYGNAEATGVQAMLSAVNVPAPIQAVAAPYETLLSHTATNLQSLGSAVAANPAPFLQQLVNNQIGYGQLIGTSLQNTVTNLPATLAELPADVQAAFQGLQAVNPAAVVQQLVTNQAGFAQTISSALQSAGQDFVVGAQALPASLQAASQALSVGDFTGAADAVGAGVTNLFITGFDVTAGADGVLAITPTGTLGELLPIFSIPGQMAQNFTNMLPAGSISAMVSQNFTNLVQTATDAGVTSTISIFFDPTTPTGIGVAIDATVGLPLALGIDALGGPINGLNALGSSAITFVNAVQTGNALEAATVVLGAPAVVADAFLNGQSTFPLTIDALGIPTTLNLPLDGILVPPGPYTATIPLLGSTATVTGTPLGGIVPALLTFLPEQLAEAVGAAA